MSQSQENQQSRQNDAIPRRVVQDRANLYYNSLYNISGQLQSIEEFTFSDDERDACIALLCATIERLAENLVNHIADEAL